MWLVEVFSRINTGGKSLTVFEIMVAKTYDESEGFDLAEAYATLPRRIGRRTSMPYVGQVRHRARIDRHAMRRGDYGGGGQE